MLAAFPIIALLVGAWLSLVERSVRDREVGGSNPLAPTTNLTPINVIALLVKSDCFLAVANLWTKESVTTEWLTESERLEFENT